MSLYNMINGVSPLALFLIPMLGDKHPDSYPRFRNVFTADEDKPEYNNHIHVYTRVGGGNRDEGYGEDELYKHPNFVATFDDDFDSTYGTYVFSVPEEFQTDFDLIGQGDFRGISETLKTRVYSMFPKLEKQLNVVFGKEASNG